MALHILGQPPADAGERYEADTSHGRSQSVDGGRIDTALFAMQAFLLFSLPLVLLD